MICNFCGKEFEEMSNGSGEITIKEYIKYKGYDYVRSTSNACPMCLDHIFSLYKGNKKND